MNKDFNTNKKRAFTDLLSYSHLKKKYKQSTLPIEEIYTITLARLYSAQNTISNKLTEQKNTNPQSLKCDDCDRLIVFETDTLLNFEDYSCIICCRVVCNICKVIQYKGNGIVYCLDCVRYLNRS